MQREEVEIHLVYEGPDVDSGSMSIEDIIPVLQGFSSAYGKIALSDYPEANHKLRITDVRPGSADIVLQVWDFLGSNTDAIGSSGLLATGAYFIVKKIMKVIGLKRHVKKQPYKENINATNSIIVTNAENVNIEVPLEILELFKGGNLDGDMNKIVRPLEEGRIDTASISAIAPNHERVEEKISAHERPYFDVEETTVTMTTETWFPAKLNSLTKSTSSGWLHLSDGTRVFYKYTGGDVVKLMKAFTYAGPVKILCVAHMDPNLKVNRVEISDLEIVQGELFPLDEQPLE